MATVRCFHCGEEWELASAETNRCPNPECGWITEIYYDRDKAEKVAQIYNAQEPAALEKSGICQLIGINGYSVSFPDQGRLADVAEQLLDMEP